MLCWITHNLTDNQFMTKMADTAKGKLLFTDGIYDFDSGKFTLGFDPNIVFLRRINRPFSYEQDEDMIRKVEKSLFIDPLMYPPSWS